MRSERWALAAAAIAGVGLPVVGGLLSLLTSDVLYVLVGLTCAVPALVGGGVAMVASRQSRAGKVVPPATAEPKRTRAPRTAAAEALPGSDFRSSVGATRPAPDSGAAEPTQGRPALADAGGFTADESAATATGALPTSFDTSATAAPPTSCAPSASTTDAAKASASARR